MAQVNFTTDRNCVFLTEANTTLSFISCSAPSVHPSSHPTLPLLICKYRFHALVTFSCFRSGNIVQLNVSSAWREFMLSMLCNCTPSLRYRVCYCVYCKLIGTSDNVRWQRLTVSLLALWQTALSVKASWLKLNLSLARPVNKRQRGDTMQFIWLTNIDGTRSLPGGMLLSPQLAASVKTRNLPPDWP